MLDQEWVEVDCPQQLPELPDQKKARYIASGSVCLRCAVLVAEREASEYFEAMLAHGAEAKGAANWLNNEYFGRLNKVRSERLQTGPVSAKANAEIVQMMSANVISSKIAKDVLDIEWAERTGSPQAIVELRGLKQMTDDSALEEAVDSVIGANPARAEEVRSKPKAAAWFVGQVMKATGGKANPQKVNAILRRRLGLPDEG